LPLVILPRGIQLSGAPGAKDGGLIRRESDTLICRFDEFVAQLDEIRSTCDLALKLESPLEKPEGNAPDGATFGGGFIGVGWHIQMVTDLEEEIGKPDVGGLDHQPFDVLDCIEDHVKLLWGGEPRLLQIGPVNHRRDSEKKKRNTTFSQ
jgi:hypothetical protein